MKYYITFSILLICYIPLKAQVTTPDKQSTKTIYQEVNPFGEISKGFNTLENFPMYPNGKQGIINHISETLQYPKKAKKKQIEGVVVVSYVVQKDGSIGEVKVVKKAHALLNKEAVRVIKLMDTWKPAIQKGNPVKTKYRQEIKFQL